MVVVVEMVVVVAEMVVVVAAEMVVEHKVDGIFLGDDRALVFKGNLW